MFMRMRRARFFASLRMTAVKRSSAASLPPLRSRGLKPPHDLSQQPHRRAAGLGEHDASREGRLAAAQLRNPPLRGRNLPRRAGRAPPRPSNPLEDALPREQALVPIPTGTSSPIRIRTYKRGANGTIGVPESTQPASGH
jgi:hypothetical protein